MKRLRWQILVIVITLAIVGTLLLAQQPTLAPISAEPASGGIYTEGLVGSFGRLNPLLDWNNPADRDIDRLIFSSLIRFDSQGMPIPDLAESWGVSMDGMVYNLSLRPNAFWHDGQPVTSDDVIFSLSLMRSEYSVLPEDIRLVWDSIQVIRLDDLTIQFRLPEPFAPFLDYLTFGIVPQHILGEVPADQLINVEFNLAPVGSGPYRFEQLLVEDNQITGVVLVVSDTYYGKIPYIEQVVFQYYPTDEEAMAAYRNGDVSGISQVGADTLPAALAEQNLDLYSSRLPRLTIVLLNLGSDEVSFLQDKNVRRALLLGLNRQWMIDHHFNGQAIIANSPLLPGTWAYYEGMEQIPYNPEMAINMLNGLGYLLRGESQVRELDGAPLSFTLIHPDQEIYVLMAETIRDNWASIGVQVELQAVSYEEVLARLAARDYQAALVDLDFTRSYDPDPYPFWHQAEASGGQNYSQWDNRTASEYLEQGRVIVDLNIRARLYRNFQVIFGRELPALPLFYPVFTYGVDVRVRGVQVAPIFEPRDRFSTIADWYLVTRRAVEQTRELIVTP